MRAIRVTITQTAGSTPRETGTSMLVWPDRTEGTIGGGALEWQAMARARAMLDAGQVEARETLPLGPDLGQCCGGTVTLHYEEAADAADEGGQSPLWIWGAGHVGRALAHTIAPLPGFAVTLIDTTAARLPAALPAGVTPLLASDMPRLVRHAPQGADHLIVTYSHQIDLALCDALLRHGFASCGLIGSATKWARFRKRLQAMGHPNDQIMRIACPIGDPALGKHPHAIALGVAAALLRPEGQAAKARDRAG